jgi:hypothetical protein
MEIVFNCPHCNQELSVDSEGSGTQIPCPTCGESITIPSSGKVTTGSLPEKHSPVLAPSPINSSAAAKVEMHLKVPVRDAPAESLIKKAPLPLEAIAKGADRQIRVRTIRHDKCIEAGHDKFDEITTRVLADIGEHNIITTHIINFEHFDVQTQKVMTDYGLVVMYRG